MIKQHILGIGLSSDTIFDTFYPGPNRQAVILMRGIATAHGEPFVYLWGGGECGKSHLLQACCHALSRHHTIFYLSLKQIALLKPAIFDGLEQCQVVCLDDIEHICAKGDWEQALFDLYNRLRTAQRHLIVTANCPPAQLSMQLPDLRSRLSWGVTVQLQSLSDDDRLCALQRHATVRGFELSPQVGHFLLNHYDRSMGKLMAVLDELDRASLEQKRKLTIPFVKDILAI